MLAIDYYFTSDQRWFNDLCKSFQSVTKATIEGNSLLLGSELGKGRIDFTELAEGLSVLCVDYIFKKEIKLTNKSSAINDYFMINFNIGDEILKIKKSDNTEFNLGETLSNAVFYSSSGINFKLGLPKNKRVRFIQLIISNKWMLNNINYYKLPGLPDFQDYALNNHYQQSFNLNLNCKKLVENILSIDSALLINRLDIKATTLELLGSFFSKVSHAMVKQKKATIHDVEKIKYMVEELFQQPFIRWPLLTELAQKCDMSKTKFHNLFYSIYGKTYLELCTEIKVKTVCKLIASGISVSKATWSVGFTNLGHFSKIFKNVTGILPSEMHKETCKLNCEECMYKTQ